MIDEQLEIGPHRIYIEGDVILSRWSGVLSLQDLNRFLTRIEPWLERVSQPFLIVDNSLAAPGVPEVRKRLFEWARTHRLSGGLVVIGATAATRVISMLVLNAIAIFKRSDFSKRVVILSDEAAARAWIDRRRRELAASPPPRNS